MANASVAIVGGGPAGLMAAERLVSAGLAVTVFERMPTMGRKLLMAGRGGLNLTHSEPLERLLQRYGEAVPWLAPAIQAFPPSALRAWCDGLGETSFIGTSGRVFPKSFRAAPLLRAWLRRLGGAGVVMAPRHRWRGLADDGEVLLEGPAGEPIARPADALLLALGGASWPRLGSDGSWVPLLRARGIEVRPLEPANCGFEIGWSRYFAEAFAGTPLKRIGMTFAGERVLGEAMVTATGLEGGAVYALAGHLRRAIATAGEARLTIDLRPDLDQETLTLRLGKRRPRETVTNHLRKAAGLPPAAIGLLREAVGREVPQAPEELARLIKAVPLTVGAARGIDKAISSAGGVAASEIDERFMLKRRSGVFVAGEMLDWEAPTGGYLLQACCATGYAAAEGIISWLGERRAGADLQRPSSA